MRRQLPILVVLLASIAVHFIFFGYPRQTVFDEVHFGKFVSGYFTHEYFFDIHPPLGKLLISGMGYATGFKPGFSFGQIGEAFPDREYMALRLLPTLAGTLLPVIFFYLILELGFSRIAAVGGAMLLIFENALLVQSRFILLDAFLLLFGLLTWLCYAKYYHQKGFRYLVLAAIFGGLAVSVKWTGATFLGIIGIVEIIQFIKYRVRTHASALTLLFVIPALLYYGIFVIHLSLLYKTGPGDAFMTPEFRHTLQGSADSMNPAYQSKSMFGKFIELNKEMYESNARLKATHPYSSKWYTWPFMTRGIYYWNMGVTSRIYLIGNPVIWWVSSFAIIYVIMTVITSLPRPKWLLVLISGAYLANMLPFIGIDRAMFLYHYFTGLVIAILALVYFIDQFEGTIKGVNKKTILFGGLVIASFITFIYFAPLTYGKPLSAAEFSQRMWLKSWE